MWSRPPVEVMDVYGFIVLLLVALVSLLIPRVEGITVLGIVRRRRPPPRGSPDEDTHVEPGDTVILYGPVAAIAERPPGREGVEEHERRAHDADHDRDMA